MQWMSIEVALHVSKSTTAVEVVLHVSRSGLGGKIKEQLLRLFLLPSGMTCQRGQKELEGLSQ